MSIERRPYLRSLLALAFALASCRVPPENQPAKSEPPITSEFSPTVDSPKSETIIFPTPKEKPTFTPVPTEIPTSTPTATTVPTPTERPTLTPTLSPTSAPEVIETEIVFSPWEKEMYQAIQELRSQNNLPPLEPSVILFDEAGKRSRDMIERGYFSHTTPNDHLKINQILGRKGLFLGAYVSEILARTTFQDSQIEEGVEAVMNRFLDSPDHRPILLDPRQEYIGVGCEISGDDWKYITIIFVSP